jgi:TRAP transporter TAXI family solute receptor
MPPRKFVAALLACAAVTAASGIASAQDAKQFEFLTFPQGSMAYSAGAAIAAVVSRKTGYSVLPVPHAGPQVFVPMLDRGEGGFALLTGNDARQAFGGVKPAYDRAYRNLRLVSVGYETLFMPLATIKSGIKTPADFKGKAVAGEFSAHQSCFDMASAVLANFGMPWSDFQIVPVPSVVPGIRAVADGRAVGTFCAAADMAVIKEVNIRTPMRVISIDPSPEAMQRARGAFAGLQPRRVKAGTTEVYVEDVDSFVFNFYLLTQANTPDDAVYAVAKAIWENLAELEQVHAAFKTWSRERMAERDVTVPYHPGAVRFYKEQAVWSADKDAATTRLLSGN